LDREYFLDNAHRLKDENVKTERARKEMEDASHILEESIPKLEANVKGLSSVELNVDFIIANVIEDGPQGQIGRKIIHY